jgi:prolyl 4-hydroxylase
MANDEPVAEFEPDKDAARLAKIGAHVAARLNANPRVQRVDHADAQVYLQQGFLSLDECQGLIGMIDAAAVPSTLFAGTEQEGFRTSSSCHLDGRDPLVSRVEARMSDVLGIDNSYAETMQGQRYFVGQQFKPHHDFFHLGEAYWERERLAGGQRTWTAMIFLDQPEAGGNTEFPELGIGVRPQAGRMLIWNNARPDGTPNHKTLHTGTPVTAGVKHIITKWYRQNDWVRINTPKA